MSKCLYCYKDLQNGETNYHAACVRRFFGKDGVPAMPYTHNDIHDLAKQVVRAQITITGVQPKLSMDIEQVDNHARFTIVGLWGKYILKPQTQQYPYLPEIEDLTMHLADDAKMATVPHTLIRFADGKLGYLTRRIDRTDQGLKLAMEDMCQLTERPTEYKYRGSYEQIAKAILRYSTAPGLDLVNFWTEVLFSWITGNSDMHLKNFSLYESSESQYTLTPSYDLVNTLLVIPTDTEELALTLNGKKRKLTRADFEKAMSDSGLNEKVISNIFRKFQKAYSTWEHTIRTSFLPDNLQDAYWQLIQNRINSLGLSTQSSNTPNTQSTLPRP